MEFLWTFNGRELKHDKRQVLMSTGGTSTLVITGVKSQDAGDYVCEARSGSLLVMSNAATLTVNKP